MFRRTWHWPCRGVFRTSYSNPSWNSALKLKLSPTLKISTFRTMSSPKILSIEDLPSSEAKWIALKRIHWSDPEGKERIWECAQRKTRGSSDIDAVAILAVLRSESNAFPVSTVIIEQYRPPIDKLIVELPAGLIDDGETEEHAAIRELEEETGFKAHKVLELSHMLVADPGMTTANMKLVVVDVPFPDKLNIPSQKLDSGEFITARVVELSKLADELKEYEEKGYVVDAKLFHFASGIEMAERLRSGKF